MRTTSRPSLAVPVVALLLSACSGEALVERAVEEAAERAGEAGVDVELDSEDGSISVETDQGRLSLGGASEVPERFPPDLPLPPTLEIQSATEFSSDGEDVVSVQGAVEGYRQVVEFYESELLAAGFEVTGTSTAGTGDTGTTQISFENAEVSGFVGIVGSGDGTSIVNVTVDLTP